MGVRSFLKNFRSGGWDGRMPSMFSPEHPLNRFEPFGGTAWTDREMIGNDFEGYVMGAFKASGPVFACVQARQFVFSEAVFTFKNKASGKLHGSQALNLLETPWEGGTTGDLLSRMEQDASLAGNSWWTRADDAGRLGNAAKGKPGERLVRLRPDWVTMIIGSKSGNIRAADAKLMGITYQPQGDNAPDKVLLATNEIVHYAPVPDPIARFRGMSWLTPILREVEADKSATKHKGAFFDNAAVPNMAVTFDKDTNPEDFAEFVEKFNGSHQGAWNAYKTLFLMGGADVTPLSHDFKSMDFSAVIGKGESRIASAAGVPASWVGFSEGMQGSALNSGNMAANRRRFADGTIRYLWRNAASSLAVLVDVPSDSVLWWDEDGIAFLREDQEDRANIMRIDMNSVDSAIKSGYKPDAAVDAVFSNDIRKLLGQHTGLVSVQMQPPVDPENELEETEGMARIIQLQAQTMQALVSAGFTEESARDAVEKNDLAKLVVTPDQPVTDWSPTGQPLMAAPGSGGTPAPAGAGKPPAAPPKPAAAAKPPVPKPASGKPKPGGGSGG
jgi:phage portal protein BeeE